MKWLILLLGIAANASASALIKLAVTPPRRLPSWSDVSSVISNWPLLLGLGLFGVAFVLYAAALARLPLSIAHPILTAGAIVAVSLISLTVFREEFHWTTVSGIALIVAGVLLLTMRA
jgi:small multidrug resistance pump